MGTYLAEALRLAEQAKVAAMGLKETHADTIANAKGVTKGVKAVASTAVVVAKGGRLDAIGGVVENLASGSEAVAAPLNAVPVIGNILAEGEEVIAGGVFLAGGGLKVAGDLIHGEGKKALGDAAGAVVGAGASVVPFMGVADLVNTGSQITTHHSINHGATIPVTLADKVSQKIQDAALRHSGTTGGEEVVAAQAPGKTPGGNAPQHIKS